MPGLEPAYRGLATLIAITMALVGSLLVGGQMKTAGAASSTGADRGVVAKNSTGTMTSQVVGKGVNRIEGHGELHAAQARGEEWRLGGEGTRGGGLHTSGRD